MAEQAEPLRHRYAEDLEQLRLQVEVMGVRVDENLERMREVLSSGDPELCEQAIAADDDVDRMNVSLIEHCYLILAREQPVASDLRFVVSVVKVLNELERVGDLALRVVKASRHHDVLTADERVFEVLRLMADEAIERYRMALRAWAARDLDLAVEVAAGSAHVEELSEQLMGALFSMSGPEAVRIAVVVSAVGRALDRIADHAAIVGARIRYLVTGEPRFLAAEVR